MTDSTLTGFPTRLGVLGWLEQAGSEGTMSGTMARAFRPRGRGVHGNHVEVNTILDYLRAQGFAWRDDVKEPSPYYHHVPAYRWYITPAGRAYHADGGRAGRGRIARELREQHARERDEASARRLALLAEACHRAAGVAPFCTRERNELICELRKAGMTLQAIGSLFGLTRERARQVIAGVSTGPCHCRRCRALR